MDSPVFQFGDHNNGDVKLQITCSDGQAYGGNPIYLHSQVLKKSGYFEVALSGNWSPDKSSSPEISLTLPSNASAENYIDCLRLLYSSDRREILLSFSNVDDALRILPAASLLLFEDGIQACKEYLEAVYWTPEQKLRIRALLSSLQVNISADLAQRIKISKSDFDEELELFKKIVSEMLSKTLKKPFVPYGVPLQHMLDTVKSQIVGYFQEDIHPTFQKKCREALSDEFMMKIVDIKRGSSIKIMDSACEALLWLLDFIKLCKRDAFQAAFKIFVEDKGIADTLSNTEISCTPNTTGVRQTYIGSGSKKIKKNSDINFSELERSYCGRVLEILVHRFLYALANGDIVIPKRDRISFLTNWVPVIARLICRFASAHDAHELIDCGPLSDAAERSTHPFMSLSNLPESSHSPIRDLKFSKSFEERVTKIIASLPPKDQHEILESFVCAAEKFQTWERGIFCWWIKVIRIAVMAANASHLQIE